MSGNTGWEDLIFLCSDTMAVPDHFNKLINLLLNDWNHQVCEEHSINVNELQIRSWSITKMKQIFVLVATTGKYRSLGITMYEVTEISA